MGEISAILGSLGMIVLIWGIIDFKNQPPPRPPTHKDFTIGSVGLLTMGLGFALTEAVLLLPIWFLTLLGFVIYKTKDRWSASAYEKPEEQEVEIIAKTVDEIWSQKKVLDLDSKDVQRELRMIVDEFFSRFHREFREDRQRELESKLKTNPKDRDEIIVELMEIRALQENPLKEALRAANSNLYEWLENGNFKHLQSLQRAGNQEKGKIYIRLMNYALHRLMRVNPAPLSDTEIEAQPSLSLEEILEIVKKKGEFYYTKMHRYETLVAGLLMSDVERFFSSKLGAIEYYFDSSTSTKMVTDMYFKFTKASKAEEFRRLFKEIETEEWIKPADEEYRREKRKREETAKIQKEEALAKKARKTFSEKQEKIKKWAVDNE